MNVLPLFHSANEAHDLSADGHNRGVGSGKDGLAAEDRGIQSEAGVAE